MADIFGSWGITKIICGNHININNIVEQIEEIEMVPIQGPESVFYACPKYYKENRNENEKPCFNRLNLIDFTSMLDYIGELIIEADEKGELVNLKNVEWNKKGVDFKIVEHIPEKEIVVSVLNKKALRKSGANI